MNHHAKVPNMRLTLIIPSMSATGGAERIMATMANYWAAKGWDITLLTFDDGSRPVFYPLHANILHLPLRPGSKYPPPLGTAVTIARTIAALRREIRHCAPQVVISFMDTTNVLTLLSTLKVRVPVIVAEHSNPKANIRVGSRYWPVWSLFRALTYPRAMKVVVLTEGAIKYFSQRIQKITTAIPNPVAVSLALGSQIPIKKNKEQTLITVGRLVTVKQFDLLLQAFARITLRHPSWNLKIFGEGPERRRLEALIHNLKIEGRVELPGVTREIWQEMSRADLFVLSSKFEGFPMALAEAMACGLPVVSFDCPFGPAEIVRDGVDGILLPPGDVAALAEALDRLMGDAALRQRLAARAPEILERFALENVMSKWEAVIEEVTRCG